MTSNFLTAERAGKGKSRSVSGEVISGHELGSGTMARIISVVFKPSPKHEVMMAHKEYFNGGERHRDHSFKIYEQLKSNPQARKFLMPTFRKTEQGLLMTDLTENGSNIVLSGNLSRQDLLLQAQRAEKNQPGIIQTLAESYDPIQENWNQDLDAQLDDLAMAAAESGVYLQNDAIFCVFKPSGEFQFIIGDLDNLEKVDTQNTKTLYLTNLERVSHILPILQEACLTLSK